MHKKTIRRRRAVLAALVGLSLILLTAYFGEAPGGALHSVQRGFSTVVSPIEDGANRVFSPVRNFFGSIGGAFKASAEVKRLRKELAGARSQLIHYQGQERGYRELTALVHLDDRLAIANYQPVNATVVEQSPSIWESTVIVDQGTPSGIAVNDPVIDGEGLVGKVAQAWSDGAEVMLINDHEFGATARLAAGGAFGTVQPKVGDPNEMVLQYLPQNTPVNPGEYVETAGTVSGEGPSLFPPGIPVGRVTSGGSHSQYESINVEPLVDLRSLSTVQVLTAVHGSAPERITHLLSGLSSSEASGSPVIAAGAGQVASTGSEG